MFLVDPIRNFYARFERPISSLSLVAGFVFDILTLHRVDTLWENMWILGHLVIVGLFIILVHTRKSEAGDERNSKKIHFWYVNILQFFFGGILSTYLVFYFRSADIWTAWPFIALLVLAFIANESLKRHYVRLSFQISLFFLSIYSFAIFLVPVVLHRIGPWIFVLSGIVSLIAIALFIKILFYFIKDKFTESRKLVIFLIGTIFALFNVLYFTNLIPPIPLSLKDAGVYHSIERNREGDYDVTYEDHGWRGYFEIYKNFTKTAGESVYAYSAVFSPKSLNTTILHEWQEYDEAERVWVTKAVIPLPVIGGRDGGFRTYSARRDLESGKWRVNIETEQGQIIGRLRFEILASDTVPQLTPGVKE